MATMEERLLKDIEKTNEKFDNSQAIQSITFVALSENGEIDEVTAAEHYELFAGWNYPIAYKIGDMRTYNDVLYKCVQAHTSQEDWTPDVTASLWKPCSDPAEEYPQWSQPIGAHDAYDMGDKVTFNGKRYESTVNNNVWQPDTYGWQEII